MATVLYLSSDTHSGWQLGDNTWRAGDNNAARHLDFVSSSVRVLTALKRFTTQVGAGVGVTLSANTVTGPTAGVPFSTTQAWMSQPLSADITISGTVNFDICGLESNMSANAGFQVKVWRIDETGQPTLIINSEHGTELGTALGRMSWTGTPTSTAMKKGNRLLVMVFINDAGGTMASGFSGTLRYHGSNANTADTSVTFTENLTFITSAPTGTIYYLRSTAHPTISNAKLLNTAAGGSTTTAVHTTVAGPATHPGDEWTDTAGGSDVRWYTPTLDAFTLGGLVYVKVPATQAWEAGTGNSPHDIALIEIAVCNADGSSAVVAGTSYQQPQQSGLNGGCFVQCQDTPVTQGQIIRVRWMQADGSANATAGTDRTISFNNNAAANADIYLQFTQTITEGVATKARPPYAATHRPQHLTTRRRFI